MDTQKVQAMKKVYFACSIAGGRDHAHVYSDVVNFIKISGAKVISELFADKVLTDAVGMKMVPSLVWHRDVKWVLDADAIIAEVTQPSLGVGYEIAKAEDNGKPILALFCIESGRRLSPMIDGNPNVTVIRYREIKETKKAVAEFIKNL